MEHPNLDYFIIGTITHLNNKSELIIVSEHCKLVKYMLTTSQQIQ